MKTKPRFFALENVHRFCLVTAALLLIAGGSAMAGPVRLAWDPLPEANVAGYRVYRGEASGGPYSLLNASLIQGFSYSDESADPGRGYYYVITAVDSSGRESTFSQELRVMAGRYDASPPEGTIAAQAGPDLTARAGEMVVLPAGGWGPEGSGLSYSWIQTLGPAVSIARSNAPEAAFLAPLVSQDTWFAFALTTRDSQGSTSTETVRVRVLK